MKPVFNKSGNNKKDQSELDLSSCCAELLKVKLSSNSSDFIARKNYLKKQIAILKKNTCKI